MRAMSTLEISLARALLCERNDENEILKQLDHASVTERSNDGWVLEFHIPGIVKKNGKMKVLSEGHFEEKDGNIIASVIFFADENGAPYELEVCGYSNDAARPFPDLSTLRVY